MLAWDHAGGLPPAEVTLDRLFRTLRSSYRAHPRRATFRSEPIGTAACETGEPLDLLSSTGATKTLLERKREEIALEAGR
jgi:hypothetical protein